LRREDLVAQLIVRNLDDAIVRALRVRAAEHGRSAEAEHREILREALLGPERPGKPLKDLLLSMPDVGEDADFERPRDTGREVAL
jgi:plasmid stability protein